MTDTLIYIYENYEKFKTKLPKTLQLPYNQMINFIEKIDKNKIKIQKIGKSYENKDLFLFEIGKGKTKIFMWSQMHGNEPVSTKGVLDLISFLTQNQIANNLINSILHECTIYIFPMVNPDGAEYFTRRNAQGIDLNRDALRLTSPEAKTLNNIIDYIQPDFAFNLHDQERYYGTQNSDEPTALSFLAPAFDEKKTIDKKREISMQLIANISSNLYKITKKSIAKYNDGFMPEAFGDNVQKKGISTILFEAGYIIGDEKREKIRKLYTLALISALEAIANKNYLKYTVADYNAIKFNIKLNFSDIILKNLTIQRNNKKFTTDISIIRNILDNETFTDLIEDYIIWDIGDLTNKKAFVIHNCNGQTIIDEDFQIKRLKKAIFLLQTCGF